LSAARVTPPRELRRQRRRHGHSCWDHLIVAPLWPKYGENLGTLLRTCDAVGACMAVPAAPPYPEALARGDTLRRRPCIHWLDGEPERWVEAQQALGWRVVAVELADRAVALSQLPAAREPTIVLLGNESSGVPGDMLWAADTCVEIPMLGVGKSLNVAVAGSLVLYRLAGLA
jgi:tRNA (guanosine-2'-O-)-methyltransferase